MNICKNFGKFSFPYITRQVKNTGKKNSLFLIIRVFCAFFVDTIAQKLAGFNFEF